MAGHRLIPGPSLHQAVETHGPLPTEAITVLGAGLAEGLAAIHTKKLVHCDLKPSNVILAEDGPRVIDFGIARALDATSHTLSRTVVGTLSFMSPEQARGDEIGKSSDVFSLGLVLAFAATGRSPFGTGPADAIVYRIVHDEPDLTGLTGHLADLVRRCLAKDPGDRPGVGHILEELTNSTQTTAKWLPPTIMTMITERLVQTPIAPAPISPSGPNTYKGMTQGDPCPEPRSIVPSPHLPTTPGMTPLPPAAHPPGASMVQPATGCGTGAHPGTPSQIAYGHGPRDVVQPPVLTRYVGGPRPRELPSAAHPRPCGYLGVDGTTHTGFQRADARDGVRVRGVHRRDRRVG
ncbi:protein kinase domain-containing protein [Streptomyces hawaiiensis]|uniref:protein kinase domain-containing protein n=1 Tax=Streptomyces hawaiiensis TaxID=67305 RepID=UPI00364D0363